MLITIKYANTKEFLAKKPHRLRAGGGYVLLQCRIQQIRSAGWSSFLVTGSLHKRSMPFSIYEHYIVG